MRRVVHCMVRCCVLMCTTVTCFMHIRMPAPKLSRLLVCTHKLSPLHAKFNTSLRTRCHVITLQGLGRRCGMG